MKKIVRVLMMGVLTIALTAITIGISYAWRPGEPLPLPPPMDIKEPAPDPKREPLRPIFELSIRSFRPTTPSIALGDEETLSWRIDGRNVRDISVELTPLYPGVRTSPGTRTGSPEGTLEGRFSIEGTHRVRPLENTTYTLRVRGTGFNAAGGTTPIEKTATALVEVRRPKLENIKPEVYWDGKIKFFAKNTGEADFRPSSVIVHYQISGRGSDVAAPAILREGTLRTSHLEMRRGVRMELGEVVLTRQQVLSHDELEIRVDIGASYVGPIEGDRDTFTHRWPPTSFSITRALIGEALGSMVTGSIRLNNYSGHEGHPYSIRSSPGRSNDSSVVIMGQSRVFSPPALSYSDGVLYNSYGYLNNINATIGRDSFSIENGKIKMNIRFETGGGHEIRAWEETGGVYHDLTAPDVDIQQLDIAVFLVPGVREGRITYTAVEVVPTVRLSFVGAYEYMPKREHVERYIRERIQNEISVKISSILMRDDIQRRIEDAITGEIRELFPTMTRIVDVRGEGDAIHIWYL